MSTNSEEVAYCTSRMTRSSELALAAKDGCARASHVGITEAYSKRLAALTDGRKASIQECTRPIEPAEPPHRDPALLQFRALSRWDNEGGALSHEERGLSLEHERSV